MIDITESEADALDGVFAYMVGDFKRRQIQQQYAQDPALWAWDKLGIRFHEKQLEIALSIINNRNTAVAAGHGTGKSFQAAILAAWWVDTHPIGSAYVATTAPMQAQISEIIFRELKRIQEMTVERAAKKLIPEDWVLAGRIGEDNTWKVPRNGRLVTVMKGRKPPDNKAGDAFQGLHARYVLAIGDEATGLTEEIIDGLANITSNDTSRRLLISNPTNPYSYLGKIFLKPTGAWNLIHVSVFDLPTFHGGGRCKCPEHKGEKWGLGFSAEALQSISGPQFVADKKLEYGEDSARYKSRVLGQFAFEAGSNLFSDKDIATAGDCLVMPSADERPILGVDVARFGKDESYVYRVDIGQVWKRDWAEDSESGEESREPWFDDNGNPIIGLKLRFVDSWGDTPLVTRTMPDGTVEMGTAERVHEIAMSIGAGQVRVDATGIGSGVVDRLYELCFQAGSPYIVVEMMSGAASPDRRAHLNNRAYQFDHMRFMMFSGRLDIDPLDEKLIDEIMGVIYEFADAPSGGGLKIESKEQMKKRGVKSPDAADAAWMAVADLSHLIDGPLAGKQAGDIVTTDVDDIVSYGARASWFSNVF